MPQIYPLYGSATSKVSKIKEKIAYKRKKTERNFQAKEKRAIFAVQNLKKYTLKKKYKN